MDKPKILLVNNKLRRDIPNLAWFLGIQSYTVVSVVDHYSKQAVYSEFNPRNRPEEPCISRHVFIA